MHCRLNVPYYFSRVCCQAEAIAYLWMHELYSLSFGGQVVHARLDVSVVVVDLLIVEVGLGTECSVSLLQLHQLCLPPLSISPLVPNVLHNDIAAQTNRL